MGSDPGLATLDKGGELVYAAASALIDEVKAYDAEKTPALTPRRLALHG